MATVILEKKHALIFLNKSLMEEFCPLLAQLLKGEEAYTSDPLMKKIIFDLIHGQKPKIILGIPEFDPTGMKKKEIDRYKKVLAGNVPSNGIDHKYTELQFKLITTLERDYLEKLYNDCLEIIKRKVGSAEYRRFISYLADVIKHCSSSGELA